MSNLLRQGAAVLLRHAFPHRLLDWLDLLAQRDPRRSRGFDHLSVNSLLLFILWLKGRTERSKKGWTEGKEMTQGRMIAKNKRGKQRRKGDLVWQLVTPRSLLRFLQAAGTYVGLWARVDHVERTVRQVKAPEAARSLQGESKQQLNESHSEGHVTETTRPHPRRVNSQMTHAWHYTGSRLMDGPSIARDRPPARTWHEQMWDFICLFISKK